MTTYTTTSSLSHNNDADFRAWGLSVSAALGAVGLQKVNDTGTIDWTTVTRASIYSNAGFEIWRFNDPLQASLPVYFRLDFGTGESGSIPQLQVTVGSGTNGAGGITGIRFTQTMVSRTVTSYGAPATSYAVWLPALGFFAFFGWCIASSTSAGNAGVAMTCVISRPADDTGAATAEGLVLYQPSGPSFLNQVWSAQNNSTIGGGNAYTLVPNGLQVSMVGGNLQLFRHYAAVPRVRNVPGLLTYLAGELGPGGTISATVVGGAHSYMPLGDALYVGSQYARCLLIWE